MSTRYLVSRSGASADATVAVTIQSRGRLVGVQLYADGQITSGGVWTLCASMDGVNPLIASASINGQTQVLAALAQTSVLTTSGVAESGKTIYVPCAEPVAQGTMLYVHLDITGTIAISYGAIFFIV